MDDRVIGLARALAYLTLLPAAGLPLYGASAGRAAGLTGGQRRAAGVLALAAAPASAFWLVASVGAMAAMPLAQLDRETVLAVAGATPLGAVLAVRLAALAALVLALALRLPPWVPALASLVALGTAAFAGHAGASEGAAGLVHRAADVAHLAAAACWIGALLVFLSGALGGGGSLILEASLARFARTGTGIVAVLLVTGLTNLVLTAPWPLVIAAPWTGLLALKLLIFAAMLALAGLNRWRLAPALARDAPGARRCLRLSLSLELACGLAVIGVVARLGMLDPAGG